MVEDISTLTLAGGHPALDLVNTVERGIPAPGRSPRDFLGTPADVVTWAMRVGVLAGDEASAAAPTSMTSLRALREALYSIALAEVGEVDWDDARVSAGLAVLDRARAAAARRTRLHRPQGPDGAVRQRVGEPGGRLVEDRVAVAAADLLTADLALRIRRCPIDEGGCGWLFLDRTKNRSRTWCRMADCGTQAKSRRLTARRREHRHTAKGAADVAANDATPR